MRKEVILYRKLGWHEGATTPPPQEFRICLYLVGVA